MPVETIIPARYNGPPTSGNGGYSCGVLAAYIDGACRVRLHVPPPLDAPLRVVNAADGGIEMYDGETLVGSGVAAFLGLDIPPPPSLAQAQAAMERYPCYEGHTFPTCFVCGPERPAHDGLEIFPGQVTDSALLACRWQPAEDMLDAEGCVRAEIVWSALDCPGYFAAMGERLHPAVLGELLGELFAPIPGAAPLVVYAWPLGEDGRKFYAGTAIATADGEVLAASRSTWIQLKA